MRIASNTEILENLRVIQKELQHFADPDNPNGFYQTFIFWTVRTWESGVRILWHPKVDLEVTDFKRFLGCYKIVGQNVDEKKLKIDKNLFLVQHLLEWAFADACAAEVLRIADVQRMRLSRELLDKYRNYADFIFHFHVDNLNAEGVADLVIINQIKKLCYEMGLDFGDEAKACEPYYTSEEFGKLTLEDFKTKMLVRNSRRHFAD